MSIEYLHHMVYLVYMVSPWPERRYGSKINRPPFTKVAQTGNDKLPLIQLLINPPSNLPHNVQRSVRASARGLGIATHHSGFRHLGTEIC